MLASVASATLNGAVGHPVSVEVHVSNGLPGFTIVGLPDAAVREARDRVRAAILSSGLVLAAPPGDDQSGALGYPEGRCRPRTTRATLRTPLSIPDRRPVLVGGDSWSLRPGGVRLATASIGECSRT